MATEVGLAAGEREEVQALAEAATALALGREDAAAAHLAALVGLLDIERRPSDLTFHVFASALGKRLERQVPGINLYLRHFDLSQISLFNLLATHLPLVSEAGRLSNEVLAASLAGEPEVVVLDVGIGTAQQEVGLLRQLAARRTLPRRVHVIGIEPSTTSLIEAGAALERAALETGTDIPFTPVERLVEDLADEGWEDLARVIGNRPLLVNAAFAAHHILGTTSGGPTRAREEFLARLRALEPRSVVLAEPNSDHQEPDFRRRFANCWNHFSTVFRLIDTLDMAEPERAAMKLFFAREIDDILANDETTRAERHEPTDRWRARLEGAELLPATGFDAVAGPAAGGIDVVAAPGYAGLAFGGELLVSVLCAAPTPVELDLHPADDVVQTPARWTRTAAESLRVRDVMQAEVPTISVDATLAEAAESLWRTGASDLAVTDVDGRFAGVLSEGDVIRRLLPTTHDTASTEGSRVDAFDLLVVNGRTAGPQPIDSLVIRDPVVLSPSDDLVLAATEMVRRQIRRLPVVSDDRRVVGSLSRADLCHALLVGLPGSR